MQLAKNFNLNEFHCYDRKGGTGLLVGEVPQSKIDNARKLAENLQVLRDYLNAPVRFNSVYRSPYYNKLVGGAKKSQHLECTAGDINADGYTPNQVADAIELLVSQGKMHNGGLGRYNSFTHYDVRQSPARWDNR